MKECRERTGRIFKFTQHNLMKVHYETPEESKKCQSRLTEEQVKEIGKRFVQNFLRNLEIDLERYILNFHEKLYTSISRKYFARRLGVLSKGSRIS